jgi:chemotaxis protein MotA
MLSIVGIMIVFGSITGGYLLEHGNLKVLFQPAEVVIIFGAAVGTLVAANPAATLKAIAEGLKGILGGNRRDRAFYLENLKMLYELYTFSRKAGMAKLEDEIDHPEASALFARYPNFLNSRHATDFLCDTIRAVLAGDVDPVDVDAMMEIDLEVHHREAHEPVAALVTMADALPGLGIVAAVLGVVITMGALGGPPEEIGHKVAAALVGTFLGVLLCYGVFGPLSSAMAKQIESESQYLGFLRMAAIAFVKGLPPLIAVEMARRAIPTRVRPRFSEMEDACRSASAGGAKAA